VTDHDSDSETRSDSKSSYVIDLDDLPDEGWDEDSCIDAVAAAIERHGELTIKEYDNLGSKYPSYSTVRRKAGNWTGVKMKARSRLNE
jgi:hypothetical protein